MHVCLLSLGAILGFGLHPGSGQGNRGKGCKAKAGKKGKEGHPLWDTAVPRPGDFRVSR